MGGVSPKIKHPKRILHLKASFVVIYFYYRLMSNDMVYDSRVFVE